MIAFRNIFTLFIILKFSFIEAQIDSTNNLRSYQFETSIYQGFIADVSKNFSSLSNQYIYPLSFSVSKRFNPIKYPYSSFNFPRYGVSFYYSNLRNPENLGNIYSLYPWVRIYLLESQKMKFSTSASLGMVYSNNIYHPTENYKNIIFSSPLFFTFGFDILAEFAVSQHLSLGTGFTFNHFSNGEIKLPNFGTNIPSLRLSIIYKNISHENEFSLLKNKRNNKPDIEIKKSSFAFLPTIGSRDILYSTRTFNMTASLNFEYIFKPTRWNRLSAGAVIFYDKAQSEKHNLNEIFGYPASNKTVSPYCTGIYFGHEIDMKPLLILFQVGKYISNHTLFNDDEYFNKIGIRYFISDHLFFNMTHKSGFFFKGNNIEWGIGYEI